MNAIVNTSIILMSTMLGAFTEVMVKTTDAMASGMAEAIVRKEQAEKKERLENEKEELPSLVSQFVD